MFSDKLIPLKLRAHAKLDLCFLIYYNDCLRILKILKNIHRKIIFLVKNEKLLMNNDLKKKQSSCKTWLLVHISNHPRNSIDNYFYCNESNI